VKNELAEAFAQLEGIESASVENDVWFYSSLMDTGHYKAPFAVRLVPSLGKPMWLIPDDKLIEEQPPDFIAEFYADNIEQRVRARRGECIFCGADCDCAEPALRKPV
jgi:hypothetical protein